MTSIDSSNINIVENLNNDVKGRKLVFFGDARNNVANSLMVICAKLGINFACCAPAELFPDEALVATCKDIAAKNGADITLTESVEEAAGGADVVYTDVWVSMGEDPSLWEKRIKLLSPYQVNQSVMSLANKDAIFLHCLPSFHDTNTKIGKDIHERFGLSEMEVTDEVFESNASRVMDQAENRLHTIKTIMYVTMKK